MDLLPPLDSSPASERSAPSQRFTGRASGTRRIVTPDRNAVASEPAVEPLGEQKVPAQSLPAQLPPRRWAERTLDGCAELDERSHGWLLWLLVAAAAASAGAVPLCMSWAGAEPISAGAATGVQLLAMLGAGFTWAARCRAKGRPWQLPSVNSRLAALPRLTLLEARALLHAPKPLKLSIASRWALGAGLTGLVLASVLGLITQLSGHSLAPVLAGTSLWSACLLLLSELLRCALQAQRRPRSLPAAELALAAREFSPVLDLSAPLDVESVFLDPTPVHDVLACLSAWRTGQWLAEGKPRHSRDHVLALQHHLWFNIPGVHLERGRRLGGAVADLVVDDAVLVELQPGLQAADVPRIADWVQRCRGTWGDKPIIIVVCNAGGTEPPDAAALESLATRHGAGPLLVAIAG
jgi:hypothetical protein